MEGGAVEAEEDAVGDGGPGGVLGVAVEAHLVLGLGLEAAEYGGLVGEGVERHGRRLGKFGARRRQPEIWGTEEVGRLVVVVVSWGKERRATAGI